MPESGTIVFQDPQAVRIRLAWKGALSFRTHLRIGFAIAATDFGKHLEAFAT